MSELKAEQWLDYAGEPMPCYPKYEADKVIAEKDKQLRHSNHKRCLDKAEMCQAVQGGGMTNRYPLHHEDARPLYLEIPQDEYDRINSRIAELEGMDNEHTLQIAKMNGYIHHLEEERRWRKFSEEKPEDEGDYLVMARYPDDDEPHIEICFYDRDCEDFGHYERRYAGSGNYFGGFDGEEWVTHNVSFWMPLPSAPKEEK